MMEERYHATTQNQFYPDMSNVNRNIIVEAKLISLPTYFKIDGINLHIMCIRKHHMKEQDLLHLTLPGYALGSSLC